MHELYWMCRWACTIVNLAHVRYVALIGFVKVDSVPVMVVSSIEVV